MIPGTAILILAAGFSKRLGESKQLLQYKNQTLLEHTIGEAQKSGADLVIVVTNELQSPFVKISGGTFLVQNERAETGMASSINTGIKLLQAIAPFTSSVIISVCDQPYISAGIFEALYSKQVETNKPLVASAYAGTFGTPALFHKTFFSQLLGLHADAGAKKVLQMNPEELATITFSGGEVDIDTRADWDNFLRLKAEHSSFGSPE